MKSKVLKYTYLGFVYTFAVIGLVLVSGFVAVKYHLTDTLGHIDTNDRYFALAAAEMQAMKNNGSGQAVVSNNLLNLCRVAKMQKYYPANALAIMNAYAKDHSDLVLAQMLTAAQIYLKDNADYQHDIANCSSLSADSLNVQNVNSSSANIYSWVSSPEWQTLKEAIAKDNPAIDQAASVTGVPSRMIVAELVGEQLRLFNSEREVYKQIFEPLKVLGNETKFSLGVAGVKEDTARQIEANLKDQNSPYYLGAEYADLLDFKTANPDQERFERLTDPNNHYYSYLYTALFLRQVEKQWQLSGFDISSRPEVLSTLFNLGFAKSTPKADPQVGGADIVINGVDYTFGSLAYQFYYSGELEDEFPLP